jgi:hypothetical protein
MMLRGTATTVEALTQGALSADLMILGGNSCLHRIQQRGWTRGGCVHKGAPERCDHGAFAAAGPALSRAGGFEDPPLTSAAMFDLFSSPEVSLLHPDGHHQRTGGRIACPTIWPSAVPEIRGELPDRLTYGNVVKRLATLAWAFTGVMGRPCSHQYWQAVIVNRRWVSSSSTSCPRVCRTDDCGHAGISDGCLRRVD